MPPSQPLSTHHTFLFGNSRQTVTGADLKALLDVVGLIRVQAWDWPLLPEDNEPFWHFNLGVTSHGLNQRYALTRILEPGTREGFREVGPLLDPSSLRVATVLRTSHLFDLPSLEDLPPSRFLLDCVSRDALFRALCSRYRLAPQKLLEMLALTGLSMTLLVVKGRLSLRLPPG
jgi:hypothetical protein